MLNYIPVSFHMQTLLTNTCEIVYVLVQLFFGIDDCTMLQIELLPQVLYTGRVINYYYYYSYLGFRLPVLR